VGPTHLCLAREIDPVHDPGQADIGKNHFHIPSAQQHGGKGGFSTFTFNDFEFAFLK
jgi:hypothetical protein